MWIKTAGLQHPPTGGNLGSPSTESFLFNNLAFVVIHQCTYLPILDLKSPEGRSFLLVARAQVS